MTTTEERRAHSGERPETVVLLSGGIDSAACVDFYLSLNRPLCAMHVEYGQGSESQERRAAERVAAYYKLPLYSRRLEGASAKSVGEIPGRNAFLVLTALMERPLSVRAIALGIHAGTSYPDCSSSFVEGLNNVLRLQGHDVEVLAPFVEWQKGDIISYCEQRRVPVHLTYSCEMGDDVPCGICKSCLDRRIIGARP